MPATNKPPTWTVIGHAAAYDAVPKWQYAEALIQVMLHKHKNTRSHAERRERAFKDAQHWIAYARNGGPKR